VLVVQASTPEGWAAADRLIREYLAELPFEIDFQDLDRELAMLPLEYGPPGGAALLAVDGDDAVGFVGVRRFADGVGELKRMYVAPAGRGKGTGRALATAAVDAAAVLGYRELLLDTVASMTAAIATYTSLGFTETDAYRHNPLPDARFFRLWLDVAPGG
jgi:GNAT superfamily N-acetyltransferase